jgi:di/tricarboxylate transporter
MAAMQVLAAIIVVVTLAAIVSGRAPAVLCLLCALIVAGFAGIAKPSELFAGLSNGGVITIAAMLVIAKGVFYTGVVSRVMYRLLSGVDSVRETLVRGAGLNPVILLTLIGTCISLTFLNPIAHQTNLMVMGPGGYSTKTFVRFGIPVTLVALAVGIAVGFTLLK